MAVDASEWGLKIPCGY